MAIAVQQIRPVARLPLEGKLTELYHLCPVRYSIGPLQRERAQRGALWCYSYVRYRSVPSTV